MGKLYYKYGVMNSSKTANLLMVAFNYESQGRRILCLKPSVDTRWRDNENESRQGMIQSRAMPESHVCELVDKDDDLYEFIKQYNNDVLIKYASGISAVLIDEAQFLTVEQIKQLAFVVEKLDISVLCFGLKNTFAEGQIFDGTAALFFYATDIEEIKTICKYCNRKAIMNMRIINGKVQYQGDVIAIGDIGEGEETYAQVCYHHYYYPPAPIIGKYNIKGTKSVSEKLNHILKYNNSKGIYRKTSDIKKENLKSDVIYIPKHKSDFEKLKYISFGPIALDLLVYSKFNKGSKVTGISITKAIIDFVYTYFENDNKKAFNLLKDSASSRIEFYNTFDEYQNALREKSTEKRFFKLPDNRWYYLDLHTSTISRFWQNILAGLMNNMSNIEVKFYFVEEG